MYDYWKCKPLTPMNVNTKRKESSGMFDWGYKPLIMQKPFKPFEMRFNVDMDRNPKTGKPMWDDIDCKPLDPHRQDLGTFVAGLRGKGFLAKEKIKGEVGTRIKEVKTKHEMKKVRRPIRTIIVLTRDGWKIGKTVYSEDELLRETQRLANKSDVIKVDSVPVGSAKSMIERRNRTRAVPGELKRGLLQTYPLIKSYGQRQFTREVDFRGEKMPLYKKRILEGLELGPPKMTKSRLMEQIEKEKVLPQRITVTEGQEGDEVIKTEYQVPQQMQPETSIGLSSEDLREIESALEGVRPPMSKGWAGSLGGSRPYRPVPYKPTGKIWKPERIHDPNPRIPTASFNMWRPPEQRHDLNPKMPVTTFKFIR